MEWAEKIPHLLPPARLDIFIEAQDDPDERTLRLSPAGEAAERLASELAATWGS